MDYDIYQEKSRETSAYPDLGNLVNYPAIGIAGETGEVSEKIKKIYRDNGGVVDDGIRAIVKPELGDVLWYVAQAATFIGRDLSSIARIADAVRGSFAPGEKVQYKPLVCALRLDGVAGALSVAVSTVCLESDYNPEHLRYMLLYHLPQVLGGVINMAEELGIGMVDVMESNLDKCRRRRENGSISGNGDNR